MMLSKILLRAGRPPVFLLGSSSSARQQQQQQPTLLAAVAAMHTSPAAMSSGGGLAKEPPRVRPPPPLEGDPFDFPERDHQNFPTERKMLAENPLPTRLGFLPENWFTAFHDKTGVTGPYMLVFGGVTYMLSKEIWVIEHDFWFGVCLFGFLWTIHKQFGKDIGDYTRGQMKAEQDHWERIVPDEIARCKEFTDEEYLLQDQSASYDVLIASKKDNIGMQVEAEYRERTRAAYQAVKSRLDYQMEVNNAMRRLEQRHMVDWILAAVRKAITPKQEEEALKKCVLDLKAMAGRA